MSFIKKLKAMSINRHNYESFFLLYIDNELCATERYAVELFVKDNPDLQKEMTMLQQTIVTADDITFNFKNQLLKSEKISAQTEENLLLYIDGELNTNERKVFELALVSDKCVAAELALLQQTKLSPDTSIIFADKQSLYRKKDSRLIPFGWWRLAAAAVFIGFGIWGTAVYLNSSNKAVVKETAVNKGAKPAGAIKNEPQKQPADQSNIAASPQPIPVEIISKKSVKPPLHNKQQIPFLEENKTLATEQKINSKPDNNLPKPYFENLNNKERNKSDVVIVTQQTQQINTNILTNKDLEAKPVEANNNIYTTSFKDDNSDQNKDDRFILSGDEPRKSKLGGFLRKAKRVLERNTKMKSGDNNVKVANLEFAIQ